MYVARLQLTAAIEKGKMDSDSETSSSSFDDDEYEDIFVAYSETGYEDDFFSSINHLPNVIGPYMYEPEAPPAESATAADVEEDIDVGILQNW